jgi:SAM-dependent methyltransferase
MNLHFGCGRNRKNDAINMDIARLPSVDLCFDMNRFPYPLKGNIADHCMFPHVLEHLHEPFKAMEEVWRICKHGAKIVVHVPYWSHLAAYADLTHHSFFCEHSFDHFTPDGTCWLSANNFYTHARYKIISIEATQKGVFNLLPKRLQWFMAHHFGTVCALKFELEAIKETGNEEILEGL